MCMCLVWQKSVGELLGMGRIGGALFLAGLFISVVVAVEASIPFTGGRTFNFTDAVWHPVVAGILIGSLQVCQCVSPSVCVCLCGAVIIPCVLCYHVLGSAVGVRGQEFGLVVIICHAGQLLLWHCL